MSSAPEASATQIGPDDEPDPGSRPSTLAARQWSIARVMILIAALAPLLALLRYPLAFGLVVTIGLIALFITDSFRRRCYGRVAWLICGFPLLPLATLHLQQGLIVRKVIRRSTVTVLDGVFGFSDIGGYLCLIAYVGCVSLVAGTAAGWARDNPGLKRAAWRVILLMPVSWAALLALAIWDPFGVMARVFR